MLKTTQKAIRETQAKDITYLDFDSANKLTENHTLRTIAMSYGIYGMNGALFMDEEGNLYKITSRTSTLFQLC